VYIDTAHQRGGLGRALYGELFERLRAAGLWTLCAGVTQPNPASNGLHEALGFEPIGTYRRIGWKKGAWHDVRWFQLDLRPGTTLLPSDPGREHHQRHQRHRGCLSLLQEPRSGADIPGRTPSWEELAMNAQSDVAEAPDDPGASATKSASGRLGSYLPGRREALFMIGGGLLGATLGGGVAAYSLHGPGATARDDSKEVSFRDGLSLLTAGNARYVAGEPTHPDQSPARMASVSRSQTPFAAILACADSRVPPEVIFDQGLGDLFVVRSAGQVIDHAVLGSLQYGVEHLETPLLVVLGHSSCGAVTATVEAIEKKSKPSGTDVDVLVEAIRPAVIEAEETGADESNLLSVSIDINVERIVERLKSAAVLKRASTLRKVKIVGGVYSLASGQVTWL
jgi:carbonic anhydrase